MTPQEKEVLRQEVEDKFCVMLERAGRENGESAEEWTDKIVEFISLQ